MNEPLLNEIQSKPFWQKTNESKLNADTCQPRRTRRVG